MTASLPSMRAARLKKAVARATLGWPALVAALAVATMVAVAAWGLGEPQRGWRFGALATLLLALVALGRRI